MGKRDQLLEMSYGTARARLDRMIMFKLAQDIGLDVCFRCGEKIVSVAELSVEHKTACPVSGGNTSKANK